MKIILEEKGQINGFQTQCRRWDGAVGDVLVSARLLDDDETCMLAVIKNITDLKNARKAPKEGEQRFRTIVKSAQDTIFLKDTS